MADIKQTFFKRDSKKLFVIFFWLLIWELLSLRFKIVLASPIAVLETLLGLIIHLDFWQTILFSSLRIVFGFLLALIMGILLAVGSYRSSMISELVSPLMRIIKAMPVASFIILALMWINTKNLSVLISFLMVVPMIYANVLQGLKATDHKLLQMAEVFHLSRLKKVVAIYIPSVTPYFLSAVSVGMGFSWKAGIAAEVIGTPSGSIGERLYEAKLYWMTRELFAWTVVIIIISVLFERLVMLLLRPIHTGKGELNGSTINPPVKAV
ncbi:MAG: binding-protein-dependent transport system inner rane component [Herbinix sp.]|jgi:NitT/TauT family transport system permease protein|nr:binding-protein-dependent transport system inner rane component [Herbinix sp.]